MGRIPKDTPTDEIFNIVREAFNLSEVHSLLKLLSIKDNELVAELGRNQKARELSRKPYEVVGDPIVELTLEAYYKDKR